MIENGPESSFTHDFYHGHKILKSSLVKKGVNLSAAIFKINNLKSAKMFIL